MRARALPLLLALLVLLVACGASVRQRTIRLTYESTNIAADQLVQYTQTRSKAIVDEAHAAGKTKEQARTELDAFLAKANKASLTVTAVYRMVAAAAVLDDDRSLKALLAVAKLLADELKEIGATP